VPAGVAPLSRWRVGLQSAWARRAPWLHLLRPLAWLYRLGGVLHALPYRLGWRRPWRAPCPVVVVGNITVGGSGKTPVVLALAQALVLGGHRVGIVSRGYGGVRRQDPLVVAVDSDPAEVGDEPLLLARRSGCTVVVGRDRVAAVRLLLMHAPVDIVLSDDGLQHPRLARDLEIVVVDARRGLDNGWCLPAGPLREPASRLRSADYVLVRGGEGPDAVRYRWSRLLPVAGGEAVPLSGLSGEIQAVAGIGQPDQFFDQLRSQGLQVVAHAFPDHHRFTAADLARLPAGPVVMTEKDALKCRAFAPSHCWYVELQAEIPVAVINAAVALLGENRACPT